jgi:hypothetical protein
LLCWIHSRQLYLHMTQRQHSIKRHPQQFTRGVTATAVPQVQLQEPSDCC